MALEPDPNNGILTRPDPPGLLYPALTNRREDRST